MTDKVQKIKDWISKEQDGLMDAQGNFENPSDEGAFHILTNLDYYIDSLQEEPVSEDLENAAFDYAEACKYDGGKKLLCVEHFKAGAEWNKKHQTGKDVLDVIEKELTRRMLEDYNLGVEEDEIERDEIAQGCMASLIMFVKQMKEE